MQAHHLSRAEHTNHQQEIRPEINQATANKRNLCPVVQLRNDDYTTG